MRVTRSRGRLPRAKKKAISVLRLPFFRATAYVNVAGAVSSSHDLGARVLSASLASYRRPRCAVMTKGISPKF